MEPQTCSADHVSGKIGYANLNKDAMKPNTYSSDPDGTSITVHPKEGSSESILPMTRSDDITANYEKLDREAMDGFQGSGTTEYEKLNKATMELRNNPINPDSNSLWVGVRILMERCPPDKKW